mmetsp:Transcript_92391/g.160148  ORF Transcript_92391/g.160148 Transcript_92391/m.160148 type:complete len:81 (-) Transcript_92391:1588-1830(-)
MSWFEFADYLEWRLEDRLCCVCLVSKCLIQGLDVRREDADLDDNMLNLEAPRRQTSSSVAACTQCRISSSAIGSSLLWVT